MDEGLSRCYEVMPHFIYASQIYEHNEDALTNCSLSGGTFIGISQLHRDVLHVKMKINDDGVRIHKVVKSKAS